MANALINTIRPGDRVTIVDRFGTQRTGRAVMRSSHGGWVLNMGGKHGTPGIADERNIVSVKVSGGRGARSFGFRKLEQFGGIAKRCEVFATAKPRARRMEYAGSFVSCNDAEDYAKYLRKSGHKARVKRR